MSGTASLWELGFEWGWGEGTDSNDIVCAIPVSDEGLGESASRWGVLEVWVGWAAVRTLPCGPPAPRSSLEAGERTEETEPGAPMSSLGRIRGAVGR